MEDKITQQSSTHSNTDAVIGIIVEILGGILGVPGLGHIFSGKLGLGIAILLVGVFYNFVTGMFAAFTLGCSLCISVPLYLGAVIFSAISVYKYMDNMRVKGNWKNLLIVVGVILLVFVIIPVVIFGFSMVLSFLLSILGG